ncbi:MAG: hypothetical protein ABSG96_03265 [Terracidiphilus sp.]|jgi:hypothetical protein
MNEKDLHNIENDRLKRLLQQALPPIKGDLEPDHDLWPDLLRRLDEKPVTTPWFDWALLAGLIGLAAFFPTAIPVLLYYL